MKAFVPVCKPYFWGTEKLYIESALDEGWISSHGRFLDQFEEGFAKKLGVKFALAVTSGTSALHLALDAAGIGPGDEVIVPDFTMMAPVFAVLYRGATPVPIDADGTWNMDPDLIEEAITPRTRAIIVVHTYGHPARVDSVSRIARRRGLFLIEDAAEALGADLGGRQIGTFGDIACFSFYANKAITTGEGGMLVTSNAALYEVARWKRNMCFGQDVETLYTHREVGYNFRMTNIQAALGLAQLENLEGAISAKVSIARRYLIALASVPGLSLPPCSDWATNVYWVFGILIEEEFGLSRAELQQRLRTQNIDSRRFFTPLHRQPFFDASNLSTAYPRSDKLFAQGVYLPSYIGMGDECIDQVAETIRNIQRGQTKSRTVS